MKLLFFASALLLLCALMPVNGLYFHVVEGAKRCFIEEVPEDVLVVGKYTNMDWVRLQQNNQAYDGDSSKAAIQITVTDPRNDVLVEHNCGETGKVGFTSIVGGEHLICVTTNTTNYYGQSRTFRFSLQLDIGEHATDYSELAKQEHLSAIEVEVRKLNDKIRTIRAEAQYQKEREAAFRDTSESINSRVLWWAVFQSCLVVAAAVYQLLNLKNFFKSKKLA